MERLWIWLAWYAPRPLVKWCAARMFAHATCAIHPDKTPDSISCLDALKAWDDATTNIRIVRHDSVTVPGIGESVHYGGALLRVFELKLSHFVRVGPGGHGEDPPWSYWVALDKLTLLPPE